MSAQIVQVYLMVTMKKICVEFVIMTHLMTVYRTVMVFGEAMQ